MSFHHQTPDDRTVLIVQQVNFINDHETDKVGIAGVHGLAGDNIPLFWGDHNDLCLGDLLLHHLRIACQLANFDAKGRGETGGKVADHLLYKGFHRGNVYSLELVKHKLASLFIPILC